jgi:predicted aspartyl protease
MGKLTEKTGLTNSFDPIKSVEVEAIVDTRTTTLALPQNIIDELGLRNMREARVGYATKRRLGQFNEYMLYLNCDGQLILSANETKVELR